MEERAGAPRRRELAYGVALLALSAAVALVLLEASVRVLLTSERIPHELAAAASAEDTSASDRSWQHGFLQRYAHGQFIYGGGMHVPHPTRGWTPRANLDLTIDGRRYRTNDAGQRNLARPDVPAGPAVLVVGDSFTFGIGADDADIWPSILQSRTARVRVLNLGVAGYGLDQMLVTLTETIDTYRPAVVVMAFIGDDLHRSLLAFRDYAKPRYVLSGDGGLVLTNVPIPPPDEVVARLTAAQAAPLPWLVAPRVLRNAWRQWRTDQERKRTLVALNTRIVDVAARTAGDRQARYVLVHLGHDRAINDAAVSDDGEEFVERFTGRNDIVVVETRRRFLAGGGP